MTGAETEAPATEPAKPLLRVVSSDATPEEIAAIVAVFASLGGGAPPPVRRRPEWRNPARGMRSALPASWRSSTLPR
ncbi:MAG: acyl-CoA carboxylase subunit epsilon [Nocardioides sp.]|uniref:acyl-CoA carboxylase subunit epsilon n=1 Tax=Nocardioides sp. TaxID=35761 RepID=UPI0039E4BCBC